MMNPWLADIFAVFLILMNAGTGFLLMNLFTPAGCGLRQRLAGAIVLGIALLAWAGLIPAFYYGLNPVTVSTALFALLTLLIVLARSQPGGFEPLRSFSFRLSKGTLFYYSFWTVLLAVLYGRVLTFTPQGIYAAPANNYGDLPYHMNIVASFVYGHNFPPQDVSYAGTSFAYPFLADFLTAFFIYLGSHWAFAFFAGNFLLAFAAVLLMEELSFEFTRNRLASRLTPFVFLFSGGFDFILFFQNLLKTGLPVALENLPAFMPGTYVFNRFMDLGTHGNYLLAWGDRITISLLTQRSILFGIPFACLIAVLWRRALDPGIARSQRQRYFLAAGILTGTLPFLHSHAFFTVMLLAGMFLVLFYSFDWFCFFVPAALLALPQALWIKSTGNHFDLFRPHIGWLAGENSPYLFWLVNNGAFLTVLAFWLLRQDTEEKFPNKKFYLPFGLLFVIANLFLTAPNAWDNVKVLTFWALFSSPWVALLLADWLKHRFLKVLAGFFLLLICLSPALYLVRAFSSLERPVIFPHPEWEIAASLREKMLPGAVVAHAPVHNSLIALTGRLSFLGYPGNASTHGINPWGRHKILETIYRGGPSAVSLLKAHNIDYVLFGPEERRKFSTPDQSFFDRNYPVVFKTGDYTVYETRAAIS